MQRDFAKTRPFQFNGFARRAWEAEAGEQETTALRGQVQCEMVGPAPPCPVLRPGLRSCVQATRARLGCPGLSAGSDEEARELPRKGCAGARRDARAAAWADSARETSWRHWQMPDRLLVRSGSRNLAAHQVAPSKRDSRGRCRRGPPQRARLPALASARSGFLLCFCRLPKRRCSCARSHVVRSCPYRSCAPGRTIPCW